MIRYAEVLADKRTVPAALILPATLIEVPFTVTLIEAFILQPITWPYYGERILINHKHSNRQHGH